MSKIRTCSVPDCRRTHLARGLCANHYARLLRNGDVSVMKGTQPGEAKEYYENVVLSYDRDECLIWPYRRSDLGYGEIRYDGKMRLVHRILCDATHGPPPTPSHESAHSCGKGHLGCVTKRHLSWKTHSENMADAIIHGSTTKNKTVRFNRLTDAERREVVALIGSMPIAAIARRFGCTPSAINHYRPDRRSA